MSEPVMSEPVNAANQCDMAIWPEGDLIDRAQAPYGFSQLLLVCDIPLAGGAITCPGQEQPAVGTESDAANLCAMFHRCTQGLSAGDLPESGFSIRAPGGHHLAVGAEGGVCNPTRVP